MALRGPAGCCTTAIVDPEYRRRVVGRRLRAAVIEKMTARGALRLVLSTAARNEAVQRLCASVGFRPTMIEYGVRR